MVGVDEVRCYRVVLSSLNFDRDWCNGPSNSTRGEGIIDVVKLLDRDSFCPSSAPGVPRKEPGDVGTVVATCCLIYAVGEETHFGLLSPYIYTLCTLSHLRFSRRRSEISYQEANLTRLRSHLEMGGMEHLKIVL